MKFWPIILLFISCSGNSSEIKQVSSNENKDTISLFPTVKTEKSDSSEIQYLFDEKGNKIHTLIQGLNNKIVKNEGKFSVQYFQTINSNSGKSTLYTLITSVNIKPFDRGLLVYEILSGKEELIGAFGINPEVITDTIKYEFNDYKEERDLMIYLQYYKDDTIYYEMSMNRKEKWPPKDYIGKSYTYYLEENNER